MAVETVSICENNIADQRIKHAADEDLRTIDKGKSGKIWRKYKNWKQMKKQFYLKWLKQSREG